MAYDIVNNFSRLMQFSKMNKDLQYEFLNQITFLKIRILEGIPTFLQIAGYLAKICDIARKL